MKATHRSQQRTGRSSLSPGQRLMFGMAAPPIRALIRVLAWTWRFEPLAVESSNIDSGDARLVCCWHQQLLPCVIFMLAQKPRGTKPGFLVSPSRDGELVARIAHGLGANVIRGSTNRTGARALRDLYRALQSGVSPLLYPDGPTGPPFIAKPGAARLAQMSGAPLQPLSFQVDRCWRLGTWDRLIVPRPFARISVRAAPALDVAPDADIDAASASLGESMDRV